MSKPLRILHTSDWHLGRTLCGRRRGGEFALFLDWLAETVEKESVDVLLVAGDIFDGLAPSPSAQELYFKFLSRMAHSSTCAHVVIISGNHDSPGLLAAPGELLKALDIHVIGRLSSETRDEIVTLKDPSGQTRLIVAAVPYPRDRDIRESLAGENPEEKEQKLIQAICSHYQAAGQEAERIRRTLDKPVPIVGMGHLFAAGGQLVEGDGVRNLYVGALGRVPAEAFPASFDYVALGHLHQAQLVGGSPFRRYSGSPLVHSFSETGRVKSVTVIDFLDSGPEVKSLTVPVFQRLARLEGDWPTIEAGLKALISDEAEAWVEVEYTGSAVMSDLSTRIADLIGSSPSVEILRLKNGRLRDMSLGQSGQDEKLEELAEDEVFRRCLEANEVPEEQRAELWAAYGSILAEIREEES